MSMRVLAALATILHTWAARLAGSLADEDGQSPLIVEMAIAAVGVTLLVLIFEPLRNLATDVIEELRSMIFDTATTPNGSP